MRVIATLVGIAHFNVWPPGQCAFYESRFGLSTPPYVFRKSQKTEFRENQKWQKCVFGHFLTSDVIPNFFLCRILKSTYRTNETFFSRTHSFGYSFQVWVGGWLIKVLKMVKTMLRMKTLVWYPDGPRGVVFAHSVQQSATRHIRCRDSFIFNTIFSSVSFLKFLVSREYHRVYWTLHHLWTPFTF